MILSPAKLSKVMTPKQLAVFACAATRFPTSTEAADIIMGLIEYGHTSSRSKILRRLRYIVGRDVHRLAYMMPDYTVIPVTDQDLALDTFKCIIESMTPVELEKVFASEQRSITWLMPKADLLTHSFFDYVKLKSGYKRALHAWRDNDGITSVKEAVGCGNIRTDLAQALQVGFDALPERTDIEEYIDLLQFTDIVRICERPGTFFRRLNNIHPKNRDVVAEMLVVSAENTRKLKIYTEEAVNHALTYVLHSLGKRNTEHYVTKRKDIRFTVFDWEHRPNYWLLDLFPNSELVSYNNTDDLNQKLVEFTPSHREQVLLVVGRTGGIIEVPDIECGTIVFRAHSLTKVQNPKRVVVSHDVLAVPGTVGDAIRALRDLRTQRSGSCGNLQP